VLVGIDSGWHSVRISMRRMGLMWAGTSTLSRPVMRRAMRNERPATSPQS